MGALLAAGLLGVLAGVLAGLFGVGGGLLFVPTLTLVLGLTQIHAEATSLLAIIPTALVGAWRQGSYGNVRWRAALVLTIGLPAMRVRAVSPTLATAVFGGAGASNVAIDAWMSCSLSVSRLLVASSRMRICGSARMARAMERRWRCPPESLKPRSPMRVS